MLTHYDSSGKCSLIMTHQSFTCNLILTRCESEETAGAIATTPDVKDADDKDSAPSVQDADVEAGDAAPPQDHSSYNIEFVFDSDATCKITILYFATEEVVNGVAVYAPREVSLSSDSFSYKQGANQTFSQPTHVIKPSDFSQEQWSYSVEKDEIPIVIHCTVENEPEYAGHSHVAFCVLEHLNDGYHIKVIKQKQCVDAESYFSVKGSDEEDEVTVSQRGVPSGYEAISLIEALNGPFPSSAKPADSKAQRIQSQGSLRRSKKSKKKDHKGSRMNLKDKNKDKDYIASEEKEAESKEKEAESKEKEAESKEKEAESKEKEAESKEKEAESKENDANTKQKDDNGDQIPQATKHSSVDESLPPKYDETFVQTVKPLTEEVNKQTVPPLPSPPKTAESDLDSDMLASSRTTTTLPGTPDHVLGDDENAAAGLENSV
ncbi:RNF157 [Bugula neritina]|uniref:RING-type E3 ubiquitin transferase n=1 Tax=Bugula neritina TaxID=10212 RepID=A0A7J7JI80_BUGNE|nr:RNF157 [Bugula neritina]